MQNIAKEPGCIIMSTNQPRRKKTQEKKENGKKKEMRRKEKNRPDKGKVVLRDPYDTAKHR